MLAIGGGTYAVFQRHNKPAVVSKSSGHVANQQVASVTTPPAVVNRGLPARLVIPKLNVSAAIRYTGLTKDGDMEAPKNIHDVGWYKYGAIPGNKGNAVIAGHLDGVKGEPGVFTDLDTLQKGDSFSVIDDKNQSVHFVVREIRTYKYDEQPNEVFGAAEGVHLNLITCAGQWDKNQRRFMQRLVVFADQSP